MTVPRFVSVIVLCLAAIGSSATPSFAQSIDWKSCTTNTIDPKARLVACNAVLKNEKLSYKQRGLILGYKAWVLVGLHRNKEALPVVNKAIDMQPRDYTNFTTRAVIYTRQRRFGRAHDDLDKAAAINAAYHGIKILRGQLLIAEKRYSRAVSILDDVLQAKPDNAWALALRGEAQNRLKQYRRALKDLNRSLRLRPNDQRALRERGFTYMRLKKHLLAAKDFALVADLDPTNINSRINHGVNLIDGRRPEAGVKVLNQLERQGVRRVLVYHNLAVAYLRMNRLDLALRAAEKGLAINAAAANTLHTKAIILKKLSRYKEAEAALRAALVHRPKWPRLLEELGLILGRHFGDWSGATALYRKATVISPKTWRYRNRLADSLFRERKYREALLASEVATELSPGRSSDYLLRGRIYLALKEPEAAVKKFTEVIALLPKQPTGWHMRGRAYFKLANYSSAATDATVALELARKRSTSGPLWTYYFRRAQIYWMAGKTKLALADIAEVEKRDPQDPAASALAAYVHVMAGDLAKAEKAATKAVGLRASATALAARAWVLYWRGSAKEAFSDVSRALKLQPTNGLALRTRGFLLVDKGDRDAAKRDLHAALKRSSHPRILKSIRTKLTILGP